MADYTELIEKLRRFADIYRLTGNERTTEYKMFVEAADAIEELQQTVAHYKGCADDWYKEACDYKAAVPRWIIVK